MSQPPDSTGNEPADGPPQGDSSPPVVPPAESWHFPPVPIPPPPAAPPQYSPPPQYSAPQYGPAPQPQYPPPPPYGPPPQYGPPANGSQYGAPYPQAAGLAGGEDPGLAEWWRRLLARIIDDVILGIVAVPLYVVLLSAEVHRFNQVVTDYQFDLNSPAAKAALSHVEGQLISAAFWFGVAVYVIAFCYDWLQHARWGQTVGKRALSTKVVSAYTGGPITGSQAVKRAAMYALVPIVPFVGGIYALLNVLWLLWDPRRQCLHDKVGPTIVVRANGPSTRQQASPW